LRFVNRKNAPICMVVLSSSWGMSYITTKTITNALSPWLSFVMIGATTITLFFLLLGRSLRGFNWRSAWPLIQLSVLSLLSNVSSVVGLSFTTSTNAAFIIQLSIVFVPLFTAIRLRRFPERRVILCVALALMGLALLTLDFSALRFNVGDLLMVVSAVSFAGNLMVLERHSDSLRSQDVMGAYCLIYLLFVAPAALLALPGGAIRAVPFGDPLFMACLILNSLMVIGAMTLQVPVSRHLSANVISICYCLEPVVTAVAAFFLLDERLNPSAWAGVALILATMVLLLWNRAPAGPATGVPSSENATN
jgi:drug/metabolite transporter (DMT)-like permease